MKFVRFVLINVLFLTIYSCSKDENLSVSTERIEIYSNTSQEIVVHSSDPVTFESQNKYVATVDDKGVVTGVKVGVTNITVTDGSQTKEVACHIIPLYRCWDAPKYGYGTTKQEVKDELGEPTTQTSNALVYSAKTSGVNSVVYIFDNKDKLTSYGYNFKLTSFPNLSNAMLERYFPLGEQKDGAYLFVKGRPKKPEYFVNVNLIKQYVLFVLVDPLSMKKVVDTSVFEENIVPSKLILIDAM
ncbi:Ig-like domain-containing protein [Prolixibacteraceae bacterium]|nr:Ig-like domain-containing protein [Prolixibacteraceae bacterium]